ncbi:protein phosphatase Slingshot homolog 2 isoform X2 [Lingula anatina]|uniref:protein-serine/threonine phosphatase n=1 Tax=Lingula anatina TaxID=7574 RepID=A0A1S3J964_LINAN|nr:protein phosphatase Slingshot homolog 2 isoform X2 [Lingula anatina]|eukprot:XP_013406761.1 protein phosphatase Slingshot homolog 2 isoform X2 [Lingula anatina]
MSATESMEPSDEVDPAKSPTRQRRSRGALKKLRKLFHTLRFVNKLRFSESYFAVKGAAMILPQLEGRRSIAKGSHGGDIQNHLQAMFYLLRPQDTIKVAVKLESLFPDRNRYLVIVSTNGRQDTEESLILGIDCNDKATVGLVLPVWADTKVSLDGDGGFSVTSNDRHHIFKPVSVQALWSALQCLHKASEVAQQHTYYPHGLTHTWVGFYDSIIQSDRSCLSEWHAMEDIDFTRPNSPLLTLGEERNDTERQIKVKLKEIMLTVDLEEVTSRYLRLQLEEKLKQNLKDYRGYIDEQCLIIMGQLDAPSKIFDYLYLGSEWNASNLEELKKNGVGFILNISREIDNFFPGVFEYYNIRVFDVEESDLLRYWEKTYKFISKAKNSGSKCLVHCRMGISRSSSTVIAFAMKEYGWSLEEALKYVQKKRSIANPNSGFLHQLEIYQGILDASKQRHNSLWRSKSENNLNNLSVLRREEEEEEEEDEEEEEELELPGAESPYLQVPALHPRSQSHEEKKASCILRDQQHPEALEAKDLDRMNLAKFEMDVELSSRSADSMDEVFPDEPSPTAAGPSGSNSFEMSAASQTKKSVSQGASQSHSISDDDQDSSDSESSSESLSDKETDDSSLCSDSDVSEKGATGLYQVASLHATSIPSFQQTKQKPHRKMLGEIPEDKHRSLAPQSKCQPQTPVKRVKSLPNLEELRRRLKRPLQLSLASRPSRFSGVRPDNSWIKSAPETPEAEETERPTFQTESYDKKTCEDTDEVSSVSVSITDSDVTPADAVSDKSDLSSDSEEEMPGNADSKENVKIKDSDTVNANPDVGALYHYEKEQIPWNPGAVKKHRQVIEESSVRHSSVSSDSGSNSMHSSLSGSKEKLVKINIVIDEPEFSNNLLANSEKAVDKKNASEREMDLDEPACKETLVDRNAVIGMKGAPATDSAYTPEASLQQQDAPGSVYEEEEIALTPGLVKKTTQEIEEKYGSLSYNVTALSLASGKPGLSADFLRTPGKGVQRSSSLRVQRVTPKVTLDKGKKTYSPILTPQEAKKGQRKCNFPLQSTNTSNLDSATSDATPIAQGSGVRDETSLPVFKIGQEEVPLAPGLVKKQTTDYESLSSETSQRVTPVPSVLTETTEDVSKDNQRALVGSVKKQTEEIEKKYGGAALDDQQKTSTTADEVALPAYKELEDDIPWAVGTVKQHKEALENISKVATSHGSSGLARADSIGEMNNRYKMNKETLGLIRAIGKHLSESPPEEPQNKVKKVTRNIELKWGIYKKDLHPVKSLKRSLDGERGCSSVGPVGEAAKASPASLDASCDQPSSSGGVSGKEFSRTSVGGKKQMVLLGAKDEDDSQGTKEGVASATPVTVKNLVGKFDVQTPTISESSFSGVLHDKEKLSSSGGQVEMMKSVVPKSKDQAKLQSEKESVAAVQQTTGQSDLVDSQRPSGSRSRSSRPASLASAIPYKKAAGVVSSVKQRPKSCSDDSYTHELSLTPTAGAPQLASALKNSEDFAQCPWKKDRKLQGRSHPLTKLAEQQNIRNNPFYSTM